MLLLGDFSLVELSEGELVGVGELGEFYFEALLLLEELLVEVLEFEVEVLDMMIFLG